MRDVVKANIFLADMGDFGAVNEVYDSFFVDPKPVCLSCGLSALVGYLFLS